MTNPQSDSWMVKGKRHICLIAFDLPNLMWQHQLIIELWTKCKILVPRGIYRCPIQAEILTFVWMNDSNSTNLLSSRSTEMVFFGPRSLLTVFFYAMFMINERIHIVFLIRQVIWKYFTNRTLNLVYFTENIFLAISDSYIYPRKVLLKLSCWVF